jgi:hypothetical protein
VRPTDLVALHHVGPPAYAPGVDVFTRHKRHRHAGSDLRADAKVSDSEQTTSASHDRLIRMTGDRWTEWLTCPNCGISGSAHFSQPDQRVYDFTVEAVPPAFKVVRLEFGEIFYCKACDRQRTPDKSCKDAFRTGRHSGGSPHQE